MINRTAFFRPRFHVVALAMCSLAFAGSATPAAARSHHGAGRHAHTRHIGHYAARNSRHLRHLARHARGERHLAQAQDRGLDDGQARAISDTASSGTANSLSSAVSSFSSAVSNVVAEARRYLGGGNPTGRSTLWCARFMNMVLEHTGHRGTGSDMAASFASYGQRVSGPQVGAIAVMARRGGGHVGVVSGIDAQGNPIVISGNYGNRVKEAKISRGRIYAYVLPN
ncbi:TIGR02594 family protein [Bradyrhizobium sp.]|uniref:TIGR02594 family protein n=1 Tax=Bradyrhizobium sp. TaxID=376 RepID=UPI0025C332D1|nr:TIGR02594 family protein [Bradyrhizobium sp.]